MAKTQSERNREYYKDNHEREKARSLAHYHANREKKRAYMAKYQKTYTRPTLSREKRDEMNRLKREKYAADADYREKVKAMAKGWAKQSPEKKRAGRLRKDYGLTAEEYEARLLRQGGGCAICGTKATGKAERKLSVDHDHKSGALRGLLCHQCNFGLGQFRDDTVLLSKAISYLLGSGLSGVISIANSDQLRRPSTMPESATPQSTVPSL